MLLGDGGENFLPALLQIAQVGEPIIQITQLGVTFPFNITFGMPIYLAIVRAVSF